MYLFNWHKMRGRNETSSKAKPKTSWSYVRSTLCQIDWYQNELSIESRTRRRGTRASTNTCTYMHRQHRRRYQSAFPQREDQDWETAGWMAGSVSNYRLLITPPDPPVRRFTQEQSPTPCLARSKILTSARNDSINNASSTIALNMYPV